MTNINELVNYFNQLVPDGNWNRIGTTFRTENAGYFYDTGTGKVFRCEDREFLVMENLLKHSEGTFLEETGLKEEDLLVALENIKNLVETEKICQPPVYEEFYIQDKRMEQLDKVQQLILELTEQCNLRCKYCIYNDEHEDFRGFSNQSITWEIAKKALDYVHMHSNEEVFITFYGGEPLLKFELMKKCIDYAIEIMGKEKKLHFGFTTNLTLLTKEMAEYFASLDSCSVTASIDGPEEIHNANRIMQNQKGSFHKAMEGLKLLVDSMGPEKAGKVIGINAVLTPPFTVDKVEYINRFFQSISWLPKHMTIRASYVEDAPKKVTDNKKITEIGNTMQENDPVEYWKLEKICNKKEDDVKFGTDNVNLSRIHQRLIANVPIPFLKQNGCCIPGNRRLYVTVEGKFHVCERIGESPAIGDVDTGLDTKAIKKYYIDEYAKESLRDCSLCWASQLCSLCFAAFYDKNGINMDRKRRLCVIQRHIVKYDLISYHQILETNPSYIEKHCNAKMI